MSEHNKPDENPTTPTPMDQSERLQQLPKMEQKLTDQQTKDTNHTQYTRPQSAVNSEKKNTTSSSTNGARNNPPPSTPKHDEPSRPKGSPLTLLISLLALGVGGLALYQNFETAKQAPAKANAINQQIQQLQNDKADDATIQSLTRYVEHLQQSLASKADSATSLTESQIQALIAQQTDQIQQSLQQKIAEIQETLTAQSESITKTQVNTLIKQAIANADGTGPTIDFSEEINMIKQNKAEIQQYLADIQQQGKEIQAALTKTATQAKATLGESISQIEQTIETANDRPIVYPLINSLTLADIANHARQFDVAAQYLDQAVASFDSLHLNQAPYEQFSTQITAAYSQTKKLAEQQNSQQQIDNIINNLNDWAFIDTNPENLLVDNASGDPDDGWEDHIKRIGTRILSKTITITKNDAAGLTWINENPQLQQIIRENIRLDLSMIRNALLIGDQARAQSILNTLHEGIGRYFDMDSTPVKQALTTLDNLVNAPQDVPDIASLIQSIKQAG